MTRFLVNVVLGEIALVGAVFSLALVLNVYDASYWRHEAIVAKAERAETVLRHEQLIKQIKREGLWDRLGMRGQPWLQ